MFLTNLSFCSLHHVKERCSGLPELVVAIVFATVVPDWECKSRKFILTSKRQPQNFSQYVKKNMAPDLSASTIPASRTKRPKRHECAIQLKKNAIRHLRCHRSEVISWLREHDILVKEGKKFFCQIRSDPRLLSTALLHLPFRSTSKTDLLNSMRAS